MKIEEKMLKQILKNQKNIMIWISKGDAWKGYFAKNIEDTEELIE